MRLPNQSGGVARTFGLQFVLGDQRLLSPQQLMVGNATLSKRAFPRSGEFTFKSLVPVQCYCCWVSKYGLACVVTPCDMLCPEFSFKVVDDSV